VTLATVSDLRVLAPHPDKGLHASRPFRSGEARADHRPQLAGRLVDLVGPGHVAIGTEAGQVLGGNALELLRRVAG
jgi:hypothetical protein